MDARLLVRPNKTNWVLTKVCKSARQQSSICLGNTWLLQHISPKWLCNAHFNYTFPCFLVAILFSFSFFFALFCLFLVTVAAGHITPETLHMGQNARLNPFMFIPYAPFKAKYCYCPGLLLMLRFVLLALPYNWHNKIIVGTGMLIVWVWISGVICKNCKCPRRHICSELDHPIVVQTLYIMSPM